jgi:hypothetical protein
LLDRTVSNPACIAAVIGLTVKRWSRKVKRARKGERRR